MFFNNISFKKKILLLLPILNIIKQAWWMKSKDLHIPSLSAKCALSQVKCFDKWKNSNCIISYLVNNIPKSRKYTWTKESRTLKRKLEKRGNNDNKIKDFYWKRDMKINSIKAEFYDKNKFEETSKFIKLCYDYPDLSYGFYWLLRARSGYRLDARIAKAAKIVDQMCPNFCPCCKSNKQWISHWLIDCPFFNHTRSKVNDKILFLYNAFNRGNLTNDIINQDISIEEIKEAILATPNYKASGPDGIPIEFYKTLVPPDDENSVNNSASSLIFLQKIYSRIWNGEFPSTWNEASIISIPKKGDDLSDCDNYQGISLINNGIKLISKIVSKRISEYGLKNNVIRPRAIWIS